MLTKFTNQFWYRLARQTHHIAVSIRYATSGFSVLVLHAHPFKVSSFKNGAPDKRAKVPAFRPVGLARRDLDYARVSRRLKLLDSKPNRGAAARIASATYDALRWP